VAPVSESDRARVVQLLLLDVEAALGPGHEVVVRNNALNVASFVDDPVWYRDKLVEDVQQDFHDRFVDTTWRVRAIRSIRSRFTVSTGTASATM
jgi:hypothetical protein